MAYTTLQDFIAFELSIKVRRWIPATLFCGSQPIDTCQLRLSDYHSGILEPRNQIPKDLIPSHGLELKFLDSFFSILLTDFSPCLGNKNHFSGSSGKLVLAQGFSE